MDSIEKNDTLVKNCDSGVCATAEREEGVEKTEAERQGPRRAYVPAVDLYEGESEVDLIVDVPGVPEGGVDLSIEKGVLTLTAVPADGVIAGKKLAYSEYGVGEYRRSFVLSDEIDREGISASLKDGVLRIKLPKSAPSVKKISVSS